MRLSKLGHLHTPEEYVGTLVEPTGLTWNTHARCSWDTETGSSGTGAGTVAGGSSWSSYLPWIAVLAAGFLLGKGAKKQ